MNENTERDELAKLLFLVDNDAAPDPYHEWEMTSRHNPPAVKYVYEMADALIRAGYTKPRQVSTVEELDALPVGSVVLYRDRAFQRAAEQAGPFGEYKKWRCGDGGFVRSTKDGSSILPATVLYSPPVAS